MSDTAAELAQLLGSCRFRFSDERDVQVAIAQILDQERDAYRYRREVRLTPRDRIDFLLEATGTPGVGGVGIEVKVAGNTESLLRQLGRYAEHPAIAELVVVTSQRRHAIALPDEVGGKPLRVAYIGGGTL